MHTKHQASALDGFDHAAITPDAIEEAIRRSKRLRSEALAAGLAKLGRAIARTGGAIWHAANRGRSMPSGGSLKPAQRS